ncbi:hypothetical protein COBT_001959 [Conglomerata obtusa]
MPIERYPIKTREQTYDLVDISRNAFRNKNMEPEQVAAENYNFCQLRTRKDLISSCFVQPITFYSPDEQRKGYSFYSVYTKDKYRGQGYAKRLMNDTIKKLLEKDNTILLTLHLNPEDEMMNFNYAFYYSLGFTRGSICEYGSDTFVMRYDEFKDFKNVRIIDVENESEKGHYMMMICEGKDYNDNGKIDKAMIDEGMRLKEKLLVRKKLEDDNEIKDK